MKTRSLGRVGAVAAGAMVWIALSASVAAAHAFPTTERPAAGASVAAPPAAVTIHYDSPIQALFAKLAVVNQAGRNETVGKPRLGPRRRTMSIGLKALAPGDYTVKWSVVAEDGHRTEGSYVFTVAKGASP